MKNCKNVPYYIFGSGSLNQVDKLLASKRTNERSVVVFFIDEFFQKQLPNNMAIKKHDLLLFVSTKDEPTTQEINRLYDEVLQKLSSQPCAIVGMGGGITLDTAKAVSNLLMNGGRAEDYQGWDLVKKAGVFKIGVPTISGTGAESSRTCVMTNKATGLKLGMNSDYTIYDQLVLDPELTATVPREQYFFTGMDSYIHCLESLNGSYRSTIGDAFSHQAMKLCRELFSSDDMMADSCRENLMVASYLGGCAIAHSFVGVVHPLSAALSVVLGIHHGLANCMVMTVMDEFYPAESKEFLDMAKRQNIEIPSGICRGLSDEQYRQLYLSTIVHEKPLSNALGSEFRSILTEDKIISLLQRI